MFALLGFGPACFNLTLPSYDFFFCNGNIYAIVSGKDITFKKFLYFIEVYDQEFDLSFRRDFELELLGSVGIVKTMGAASEKAPRRRRCLPHKPDPRPGISEIMS